MTDEWRMKAFNTLKLHAALILKRMITEYQNNPNVGYTVNDIAKVQQKLYDTIVEKKFIGREYTESFREELKSIGNIAYGLLPKKKGHFTIGAGKGTAGLEFGKTGEIFWFEERVSPSSSPSVDGFLSSWGFSGTNRVGYLRDIVKAFKKKYNIEAAVHVKDGIPRLYLPWSFDFGTILEFSIECVGPSGNKNAPYLYKFKIAPVKISQLDGEPLMKVNLWK